ncbi:probable prolyl 4-hydroxylase 3 isoform X2 [Mizuhopecten yessoensis]|uniref:probable prolyl 4-hydroxylase 3 isoform X2 n=1 Tax=Mizuhopecten yessoensis TaxID=6573 RepID=UPI000B45BE23|nr:probable prolyl 4-hydroxylase 3 isoform X2 [Mizuhopecten yessoensis]
MVVSFIKNDKIIINYCNIWGFSGIFLPRTLNSGVLMASKTSKTIFHDKHPNGTAIVKEELKLPKCFSSRLAFMLYNVFSKEECEEFIKHTRKLGYQEALVNIGFGRQKKMTDVRNNDRCIWDTLEESGKILNRIKPYLPPVWNHHKLVGLNERLRTLYYQPGQYFKPHFDGEYRRTNGERSYVTVQVYLNEGFKGGETTFMDSPEKELCPVVPKTGSVLVFQHDILHEGSTLIAGEKFTIRTDVMYSGARVDPEEENAIIEAHKLLLSKPDNAENPTEDENIQSCSDGIGNLEIK